jgi:S1-C subfamily serine protease
MATTLVEFSNELANTVERAGASVLTVLEGGREGVSGTLWRERVAITADHTIRGLDEVTVVLANGNTVKAQVAGRDAGTDIAVLRVPDAKGTVTIADDAKVRAGEVVLAIGRRKEEGIAATFGVVSAVGGPWRTWSGARIDRWLRLDLNPFAGFSGGPVVNTVGEAIAMATSGPRRSLIAIPSKTINRVVDQLLLRGRVARGYLGVGLQPVAFPPGSPQSQGVKAERGLLLVAVAPGSPAEKAGMLIGDIIVSVEGQAVSNLRSLQEALDSDKIGSPIALEIVRGGQMVRISPVVGESPEK